MMDDVRWCDVLEITRRKHDQWSWGETTTRIETSSPRPCCRRSWCHWAPCTRPPHPSSSPSPRMQSLGVSERPTPNDNDNFVDHEKRIMMKIIWYLCWLWSWWCCWPQWRGRFCRQHPRCRTCWRCLGDRRCRSFALGPSFLNPWLGWFLVLQTFNLGFLKLTWSMK